MVKFSAIWLILLVYKSKLTLQDQYDNVILVHLHYDLTFDFERYGHTVSQRKILQMYISKQTSYDKRLADILIYLYLHSSECDLKVTVTVFLYISMLFEGFQKF